MQRRLHSPLSPNFLEKQFSDGNEKNNMSIASLEITSLYKLEKEEKGKRTEIQNRVPPEGTSKTPIARGVLPVSAEIPQLCKAMEGSSTKSRSPFSFFFQETRLHNCLKSNPSAGAAESHPHQCQLQKSAQILHCLFVTSALAFAKEKNHKPVPTIYIPALPSPLGEHL